MGLQRRRGAASRPRGARRARHVLQALAGGDGPGRPDGTGDATCASRGAAAECGDARCAFTRRLSLSRAAAAAARIGRRRDAQPARAAGARARPLSRPVVVVVVVVVVVAWSRVGGSRPEPQPPRRRHDPRRRHRQRRQLRADAARLPPRLPAARPAPRQAAPPLVPVRVRRARPHGGRGPLERQIRLRRGWAGARQAGGRVRRAPRRLWRQPLRSPRRRRRIRRMGRGACRGWEPSRTRVLRRALSERQGAEGGRGDAGTAALAAGEGRADAPSRAAAG